MTTDKSKTTLLSLAIAVFSILWGSVQAAEKKPGQIEQMILTNTNRTCEASLHTWMKSSLGTEDPNVQVLLADCLMGQARLALLGNPKMITGDDTRITEIPSAILKIKYNLDTSIYRLLAGRWIRVIESFE